MKLGNFALPRVVSPAEQNLGDEKIRTFTFDRDYNVGFILFEQPLPTLSSGITSDGGRAYNAMSLDLVSPTPCISGLKSDASCLGSDCVGGSGRLAERQLLESESGRGSYGMEFDLNATYSGIEHLDLMRRVQCSYPVHTTRLLRCRFHQVLEVFGGQLIARVHF